MEWSDIEANWTQVKGLVKSTWGKISDDDLTEIKGQRERMIGKLQEHYNVDQDHAEAMLAEGIGGIDIQGEGNYQAAKKYQEAQHNFASHFSKENDGTSS